MMKTKYDPRVSAEYAKEISDRFGKEADVENNPGQVDHAGYPHGINPSVKRNLSSVTMEPVVKTPNAGRSRRIVKKPIQGVPKEHFGIYAASEDEIHLENYCAEHGNGCSDKLMWSECPACDSLFFARDDYLCRGCRAAL